MSNVEAPTVVQPLNRPLSGSIQVPGDKSISHRSVLFSAMAEGTSQLTGVLDSADVRSSIGAVTAMGAQVNLEKQPDGSLAGTVTGWGAKGPQQPDEPIDCGNSGTTVRLLMGIIAPWDIQVELTGDDSLVKRPMKRIFGPLSQMGATFTPEGRTTLPLVERGSAELTALDYESPVASAQLKTALILAGIFAKGTTQVHEPAPSRNHTELMLPEYGVQTEYRDCYAAITGPQALTASTVQVPGDPSSATFHACAAALMPGSAVEIQNVSLNPARIGFATVLERMGSDIQLTQTGAAGKEISGTVSVRYVPNLHACEVAPEEIASMVDEIPVLALVAAFAEGITVFHGAGELRVKETDRFAAIIDGLAKLGVKAWAEGDDLCIQGQPDLQVPEGLVFDSLGDHRLAMTWAIVGLTRGVPVTVERYSACGVSYPGFMDDIRRLS